MQYTLIKTEEGTSVVTVFVPGRKPEVAESSHPNFDRIVAGALAGDDGVIDLFDIATSAGLRFEALSDRVSHANGRLYLDNEEVDNSLAKQVIRFLDEGKDFMPLVNFFENVQANPNEHSREQLFSWLDARDFTITDDGYIVGYKGVNVLPDGSYVSVSKGKAIVDGVVHNGQIPNPLGATVEMPRSEVHHDPKAGCSTGLHVGSWDYASTFAQVTLEVEVNPRDVVSVPTESSWAKVRVCRYTVVDVIDAPYTSALRDVAVEALDESSDLDWGEQEDDDDLDEGGFIRPNLVKDVGVYRGDQFVDNDSRRGGRFVTVENVDADNGTAECRSSSTGKLTTIAIDRLLSKKYDRI